MEIVGGSFRADDEGYVRRWVIEEPERAMEVSCGGQGEGWIGGGSIPRARQSGSGGLIAVPS